jgi:DNA-binding Lrp family transcriptional regulator
MALTSTDLASMKLPAAALVAAIVVAFVIVDLSVSKRDRAKEQLNAQSNALSEVQQRYHRSGEEVEFIHRYLPDYRQLQERGFVGSEQRVNWIESLRAANQRAGLSGVKYQLSAQDRFPYVSQTNPMSQQIRHSQMKLNFGLVHEGELMRLFRELEAQRSGVFALTGCSLDRGLKTGNPIPREANLTAECDISWLTIAPEGGNR